MTWVSTRALVEGKEPGYGAGCGGHGDFPLRRGVMFMYTDQQTSAHLALGWLWYILGLALQGPSQTTEIDANRSAVFCNGFFKKRNKNTTACFRLCSHIKIREFYGHRTLDLRRVFDF